MMVLTGGKLDLQGSVPKPSFYLVSNHLSYADIWVLSASLRATITDDEIRTIKEDEDE